MQQQTLMSFLPDVEEKILNRALAKSSFKSAVEDLETVIAELGRPTQDANLIEHWERTRDELLDELRRLARRVEQAPPGNARKTGD